MILILFYAMTEKHPGKISAVDAAILGAKPAIDAGSKVVLGSRKTVVDWEDAAQETVAKLLLSRGFADSANQAGYANTSAKNTAKTMIHREGNSSPVTTEALERLSPDAASSLDVLVDSSERERRHEALQAAIKELPRKQKEVIKLYQDGLSFNEIAVRAGIARGTVGPYLGRAIKNLRSHLVGPVGEDG